MTVHIDHASDACEADTSFRLGRAIAITLAAVLISGATLVSAGTNVKAEAAPQQTAQAQQQAEVAPQPAKTVRVIKIWNIPEDQNVAERR